MNSEKTQVFSPRTSVQWLVKAGVHTSPLLLTSRPSPSPTLTITEPRPGSKTLVSSVHLPPGSTSMDTILLPAPLWSLFPPLVPSGLPLCNMCLESASWGT